ncbi:XRE family transcriptional regulator [Actinomadura logoneensis]|uniref:XRE family transcriptional regulator n=2 Tax=Actinomadura logoneensis TaxID=2293572 RepID=A0A372JI87_9ACTN|nr:XRE family transcriptional regulator [Actinomadura logoneensis]
MWHFLAFYLRFMREKEGLSLAQWGKIIGAARSSVSNMEAGRHKLQVDQARRIDVKLGTGGLFELLLYFARTAHDPNWFRQYSQFERKSDEIRIFHGQAVPLLLQTDDYTRAYARLSASKDLERVVSGRIARKRAIFEREDPPYIWAILDEAALARPVGGREAMRAQIQHLIDLAERWNVILRIVPFSAGAHPGADGSFQLVDFEGRDIAYAGAQAGGRLIEMAEEVKLMIVKFDRIGAKAASEDASLEILRMYLERYA